MLAVAGGVAQRAVAVDPRVDARPESNVQTVREPFTRELARTLVDEYGAADMLWVAMHADGATTLTVDVALEFNVRCVVVPCCPDDGEQPYAAYCAELLSKGATRLYEDVLDVDGRNAIVRLLG